MKTHNLQPTASQIRWFGVLLGCFAAVVGALTVWRSDTLSGLAIILAAVVLVSLVFNGENRPRQLWGFAFPLAFFLCGWTGGWITAAIVAAIGLAIGIAILLSTQFGKRVYNAWMIAAEPLGWTISRLILALVFLIILTPIGLIMRLFGYDPMCRQFKKNAPTYWVHHDPQSDSDRYFRQF